MSFGGRKYWGATEGTGYVIVAAVEARYITVGRRRLRQQETGRHGLDSELACMYRSKNRAAREPVERRCQVKPDRRFSDWALDQHTI
jgi:hypothetical protein